MFYLVTGQPGASKTLNTIKYVHEEPQFRGRPIYQCGLKELTFPWEELTPDEVLEWYDLPEHSVIIVDEAQYIFKVRKSSSDAPRFVMELSTHRHKGYDIFLITQHPTLIDSTARKFVNVHWHFDRQFGWDSARRRIWQSVANDPSSAAKIKEAETDRVKFDKSYYGKYKSADFHTAKKRIPFKVWVGVIALVVVIVGAYSFVQRMKNRYVAPDPGTEVSTNAPDGQVGSNGAHKSVARSTGEESGFPMDPVEYAAMFTPRIAGLPHTAPVYDGIYNIQSFPRLMCYRWETGVNKGKCTCVSQQATALTTTQKICNIIIDQGMFDPTIADSRGAKEASKQLAAPPVRTDDLEFVEHRKSVPKGVI